jgi:hypothetical protein
MCVCVCMHVCMCVRVCGCVYLSLSVTHCDHCPSVTVTVTTGRVLAPPLCSLWAWKCCNYKKAVILEWDAVPYVVYPPSHIVRTVTTNPKLTFPAHFSLRGVVRTARYCQHCLSVCLSVCLCLSLGPLSLRLSLPAITVCHCSLWPLSVLSLRSLSQQHNF